jgi:GNAT superfamily N-acetyltransferase
MHFRTATPDDAAAIAALAQASLRDAVPDPDGPAAAAFWTSIGAGAQQGYLASPRFRYTLAESEGRLAGVIAMRDTSHLFHLFVARAFQRQGLAARLWALAREQAHAAGHAGGFTVNAAPAAVPVYERFGFIRKGELVRANGIVFQPMTLD